MMSARFQVLSLSYQRCTQANLDHTPTQSDKYLYEQKYWFSVLNTLIQYPRLPIKGNTPARVSF